MTTETAKNAHAALSALGPRKVETSRFGDRTWFHFAECTVMVEARAASGSHMWITIPGRRGFSRPIELAPDLMSLITR